MDYIGDLCGPQNWSLLLVDEQGGDELYFALAVGEASDRLKEKRLRLGEGLAGWAAKQKETIVIKDAYSDTRFAEHFDADTGFKTESVVCIPMVSKGNPLGVIEILNIPAQVLSDRNIQMLEAIADLAAVAIENARYISRIEQLSIRDDWTGLYNARHMFTLMDEQVRRHKEQGSPFSLIFFDMDYFKEVNDAHGHLVGAELLREIGDLLKNVSGPGNMGIRYGGDEFVLIMPGAGKGTAMDMVTRLRDAITGRVFFNDQGLEIRVTASFGVSTFPDDAQTRDGILRMADKAMYRVKETGRNGICRADRVSNNPEA
jgi:diguanylate cyclase (GGDEF)-like protein